MTLHETDDKSEYATTSDTMGCDYREIANTLTLAGYPMNHSSARNYVMRAVEKIAKSVITAYDGDESDSRRVARDPNFQASLAEILREPDVAIALRELN